MLSKSIIKILLLLWIATPLLAIEGKIKVFIPSKDVIYTSQKMTVAVEVLSSAFSITNVQITFPPSDKYLIQAPRSASYLGREEVGEEEWQMVHYDYDVYALKAGRIDIPSVLVTFTASMGYGQPKKEFEINSDALSFEVISPKGVKEEQFVLVTKAYALKVEQTPEVNTLIVGDAIELAVIQKAHHVPDILLSPVTYASNANMRVYPKEPELKSAQKGKFDVSRKDTFTLVASVEGNVSFPAQEKVWYDSVNKELHTPTIPQLQFQILPDPQIAIDAQNAKRKQVLFYALLAIVVMVLLYVLYAKRVKAYYQEKAARYAQSEAGHFEALLASVQNRPLPQVDFRYTQWLMQIKPILLRGGISDIEILDETFAKELRALYETIINDEKEFHRERFSAALKHFREVLLEEKALHEEGLPKEINPG